MDKAVVLFTMKSCPFCVELKEMLEKENIPFVDRDIDQYEEEYELFVEATGNDYVPSFILIEDVTSQKPITELFAPDRDFDDINEGFEIIKSFING
jgi:glutaredoxin